MMTTRPLVENADTVSLVCALLVRFPELASIRSLRGDRHRCASRLRCASVSIARRRRDSPRPSTTTFDGFLALTKDEPAMLRVECEGDRA